MARCPRDDLTSLLSSSGIGFAVAQRLLSEDVRGDGGGGVRVCLACRNREKAESARRSLLESFPGSKIDILDIDVSSVSSVIKAATELQRKYVLASLA